MMTSYTKTGLLFLMISMILALFTALVTYGIYSIVFSTHQDSSISSFIIFFVPIAIIAMVVGLLSLLGAIFIYLGRKEFGEKHQRYIFYSLILFIILIGAIILIVFMNIFIGLQLIVTPHSQVTPADTAAYFKTQLIGALIQSFVTGLFSGLIWFFALYNLENRTGRRILLAAVVLMILAPLVSGAATFMMMDEWTRQGFFDNPFNTSTGGITSSQLISASQWMGLPGIIIIVCYIIEYVLLFIALYIPYKRIATGELLQHPSPG